MKAAIQLILCDNSHLVTRSCKWQIQVNLQSVFQTMNDFKVTENQLNIQFRITALAKIFINPNAFYHVIQAILPVRNKFCRLVQFVLLLVMQSLEILTVQFPEDGVFNTTFSFFQYFCQPFLQTRLSLLALKKQEGRGGEGWSGEW